MKEPESSCYLHILVKCVSFWCIEIKAKQIRINRTHSLISCEHTYNSIINLVKLRTISNCEYYTTQMKYTQTADCILYKNRAFHKIFIFHTHIHTCTYCFCCCIIFFFFSFFLICSMNIFYSWPFCDKLFQKKILKILLPQTHQPKISFYFWTCVLYERKKCCIQNNCVQFEMFRKVRFQNPSINTHLLER